MFITWMTLPSCSRPAESTSTICSFLSGMLMLLTNPSPLLDSACLIWSTRTVVSSVMVPPCFWMTPVDLSLIAAMNALCPMRFICTQRV